MTTPLWDDFEEEIERGLQGGGFGENFLVKPQVQYPNEPIMDDGERPHVQVCGVFTRHYRADDFNPSALSTRGLKFTEMSQRDPILEVVAHDLPYQLKKGDLCVRCRNGVVYEVIDPQANGHGILYVKLIERGISQNSGDF